jgi:hypothetical protein
MRTHVRFAYLFPSLHLFACLIISLGYFVPGLKYLFLGEIPMHFLDFPVSVVALGLAWRHPVPGLALYVVIGTIWWFYLGRRADQYRARHSHG